MRFYTVFKGASLDVSFSCVPLYNYLFIYLYVGCNTRLLYFKCFNAVHVFGRNQHVMYYEYRLRCKRFLNRRHFAEIVIISVLLVYNMIINFRIHINFIIGSIRSNNK